MKKALSVILAVLMLSSLCVFFANAADTTALAADNTADTVVDGIGYDLYVLNDVAYARVIDASAATGAVEIPATVTYEDVEYTVVAIVAGAFTGCVDLVSVKVPAYTAFTVVTLENTAGILNGIFVDCNVDENGNSAPVKLYYNSEQAAIAAYTAATSDNITYYPYGMDEDINEGIFDIITRIWKMILDFLKSLFGIA